MRNRILHLLNAIPRNLKSKVILVSDFIVCILIFNLMNDLVSEYKVQFSISLLYSLLTVSMMSLLGCYKIPLRFYDINNVLQIMLISLINSYIVAHANNLMIVDLSSEKSLNFVAHTTLMFIFYKIFLIFILKRLDAIAAAKTLLFCNANISDEFLSQFKRMPGVTIAGIILDDDLPIKEIAGVKCISLGDVQKTIESLGI